MKTTLLLLSFVLSQELFAMELRDKNVPVSGTPETIKALEDAMTVYVFDPDQGSPSPVCVADCAEKWPPVLVTAVEESQLAQLGLGTIKRKTGLIQLTYKGRPLYTFFADRLPVDAKGNGLGGVWHVVKP